jgi:membrane-bound serine protease (ClpP class)
MSGLLGGIALVLLFFILRVRRLPVTTGVEGMVGAQAVVTTALRPIGRVRYGGENWEATLDQPDASLEEGAEVQIVAVDGLRLQVRPLYAQQQQQFSDSQRPSSLHSHEA